MAHLSPHNREERVRVALGLNAEKVARDKLLADAAAADASKKARMQRDADREMTKAIADEAKSVAKEEAENQKRLDEKRMPE